MRYICANCGYIYDPDQGDPMNDIPPGTAFADLPDLPGPFLVYLLFQERYSDQQATNLFYPGTDCGDGGADPSCFYP